ncbi:uncharacterized protein LOC129909317 [Episyrphus balteatus]|uniref:uncharacterized protein LOC129909317 n=1 Tax=Episyrphus balteatus TaxID=286459 RepID=UPI002485183D|nr:uncharacterized protein LOC129909317 [Episyrphus balteatus]
MSLKVDPNAPESDDKLDEIIQQIKANHMVVGNMPNFIPGSNFSTYEVRLKMFFKINRISTEDQVGMLLTLVSDEVLEKLMQLVPSNAKPEEMSLDDLLECLRKHYSPGNVIAERFKFYNLKQTHGEKISDFVVRLKFSSQRCEFPNVILDEMLRDIFIVGLTNNGWQQKLIDIGKTLKFDDAVNKSLNFELTESETRAINTSASINQFHHWQKMNNESPNYSRYRQNSRKPIVSQQRSHSKGRKSTNSSKEECQRCDRSHHKSKCPAVNWTCYRCKKRGHIVSKCRAKKVVYFVDDAGAESSDGGSSEANTNVDLNKINAPLFLDVMIADKSIKMEVDCGACTSVISHEGMKSIFLG